MNNKQVAEFFVEQHVLQPSQVEDVLSETELNGKSIEQAMVDGGFVDELGFYQTIANGLGIDFVDLTEREIVPEVLRFIPSGLARLHGALPIEMSGNALREACQSTRNEAQDQIENLIKQYYGTDTTSM